MFSILKISIVLLIAGSSVNFKVLACSSCMGRVVAESFKESDLVPDVISKAPSELATVKYGDKEVYLGNEMSVTNVALQPKVTYEAEYDSFYTLAMIDPDAPSRKSPLLSPVKHWLVINIPGNYVEEGQTLNSYLPPTPPPGTGPHRYTFLVYKQDCYIDIDVVKKAEIALERIRFSIEDFAKKYNLRDLVAGNFFIAELVNVKKIISGLV